VKLGGRVGQDRARVSWDFRTGVGVRQHFAFSCCYCSAANSLAFNSYNRFT
jgi:hypothetical protein